MLIKEFKIRLEAPPCTPGAEWWHAYADLDNDISEVLPYLNAELENCEYIHENKHLVWLREGKIYVFKPLFIAISPLEDKELADPLFSETVEIINDTWNRKDEIIPDFKGKKPLPGVLDIFKILPGTNCGDCGYPTCIAFATELRADPGKLPLCPGITNEDYSKIASE